MERKKNLQSICPNTIRVRAKTQDTPPTPTAADMTRSRLTYHYNNWFINRIQLSFNMGEARALQPVVGSEEGQQGSLNLRD